MATQTPHVLVVDDSCVDCLVASTILNSFNIRVIVVEGAMEALEFLDAESPKRKHIPVVITCADVVPERIIECLEGGAEEYIVKPLKASDVPHILSYM